MSKIKIGIIGCGYMAQMAHIPCFASIKDDVQISALCDTDVKRAELVAERWNIKKVFGNIDELLASDIDAVAIFTQVQLHKANVITALKAGKHVFVEKPLAMSAESVREIREIASQSGKTVSVGYMKRHECNIQEYLKNVDRNKFGKPLFIRAHSFIGSHWDATITKLHNFIAPTGSSNGNIPSGLDNGPAWLKSPRDSKFYSFDNPYYGLLDTGCHSVNLLRFLAGKDFKVLNARNVAGVRTAHLDFDGFDGIFEFCVNFNMRRWDETAEIFFEKATVKVTTNSPLFQQAAASVEVYREDGQSNIDTVYANNHDWAFQRQVKDFVERVKNGDKSLKYIDDSEKDISAIEEIFKIENNIR